MSEQDVAATGTALFFSGMRFDMEDGTMHSTESGNESESSKRKRASESETIEMQDPDTDTAPRKKMSRKEQRKEATIKIPALPVEPTLIHVIKKRRGVVNHSYKDYSRVPATIDYEGEEPIEIREMSFPQKLHHMLAEKKYSKWISWMSHGRSFRIHLPVFFEKNITGTYFDYNRFGAFVTQLNSHGFKHISQGHDRNCYYHGLMLRGYPHLTKYMAPPRDPRRVNPDPENEPDFYAIDAKYPLPGNADQPVWEQYGPP